MLENCCSTCGSNGSVVHHTSGIQKRRHPKGQFVCLNEWQPWHLQLEILQREFDLTKNQNLKAALRLEIETIILEHCIVDGLEVNA
jgi:hypothetical protein